MNDKNIILAQFKTLISSAVVLKEKFDLNEPAEAIYAKFQLFLKDLEYLRKLIPNELIQTGDLLRHISWIERRLNEGRPDLCYSDIEDIVFTDIFTVENRYFYYSQPNITSSNKEIDILNHQLQLLRQGDCDGPSWLVITERLLKKIFPEETISLAKYRTLSKDHNFTVNERNRFESLLKGFIQELELGKNDSFPSDKWSKIHNTIAQIAKSRFETEHYGDAVEASFKEINDIIKKSYHKNVGKEEDGDSLMRKAFSVNNPLYHLADNNTDSGRNIQQGYMDIFAGAMKGIRNPKAHANLDVHPDEAWEMIVLASHLMRMWDKTKKQ